MTSELISQISSYKKLSGNNPAILLLTGAQKKRVFYEVKTHPWLDAVEEKSEFCGIPILIKNEILDFRNYGANETVAQEIAEAMRLAIDALETEAAYTEKTRFALDALSSALNNENSDLLVSNTDKNYKKILLSRLAEDIEKAENKHPSYFSAHEGYSVILKELEELREYVRKDTGESPEAIQKVLHIAVAATRYAIGASGGWRNDVK
jgi:hypothetical protein